MKKKVYWYIVISIAILALVIFARPVAREIRDAIHAYILEHTDIPKLYFTGDISEMLEKSDIRKISFKYVDDAQNVEGYAEIRIQGTSSIYYDKKNYTLKFFEDESFENKLKIDVGWGPQNKYCMKANWIDRTQARNVVTARLAARMQAKYNLLSQAPNHGLIDGFPVEIFNNGEFLGLYTFNIPKDDWQFGMDSDNPNHIVICGEGWDPANLFEDKPDFETWAVEVGEESDETLEKMNRLFDFVMNSSDEDFKAHFEEYLNLDSALNYYVMADLAYLKDNLGKNMLIATYDGMIWYLSLYDLDSSWGTSFDGQSLFEYESTGMDMASNKLFRRMEQAFPGELAQRYFELRKDIISNQSIMTEFESFRKEIPEGSFEKEAFRWSPHPNFKWDALPGYDYDQIEAFLRCVSDRLDAKYAAWLN